MASQIASENRAVGVIWVAGFSGSMDHKKMLGVSRMIIKTAQQLTEELAASGVRAAGKGGGHRAKPSRMKFDRDLGLPAKSAGPHLERGSDRSHPRL